MMASRNPGYAICMSVPMRSRASVSGCARSGMADGLASARRVNRAVGGMATSAKMPHRGTWRRPHRIAARASRHLSGLTMRFPTVER